MDAADCSEQTVESQRRVLMTMQAKLFDGWLRSGWWHRAWRKTVSQPGTGA